MSAEFSILANMDAFLLGMQVQSTRELKKTNDFADVLKTTASSMDEDFRSVYDRLMPNVHILDIDYTVKLIFRDMKSNPGNYFSKIKIEEDGAVYEKDITPEILPQAKQLLANQLTTSVKATIRAKVIQNISEYHKNLPTFKVDNVPHLNPIEALNEKMRIAYTEVQTLLSDPSILDDVKIAQVARLGSLFRKGINEVFGKNALLKVDNKDLGSSDTRLVFFSKNFKDLSVKINPKISEAFKRAIAASENFKPVFVISDSISVGKVAHYAHTALKSGNLAVLNSPGYAKLIFNTSQGPATSTKSPFSTALKASDYFKKKTGHIRVGLKVDKSVITGQTNILMQLGLTFTTDHSSGLNLLMSKSEAAVGSGQYTSARSSAQALRNFLTARRAASILDKIVGENPQFGTSSDSLMTMMRDTLKAGLTGKKYNKKSKSTKDKDITFSYLEPKNIVPIKKVTSVIKAGSKPSISEGSALRTQQGKLTSLANLQSMLNLALAQRIQQNMGTGASRNILNYRSGRLAESAEVTRMSQSREGMITAFYTYMRNPYGTFSEGGAQSSPPSRDPKLLISKSIREVLATQVNNRLRAVLA